MMITIDGVAASGKSTVASGVARALGVPYVSSGLLYRAAALSGLEAGLPLSDARALLAQLGQVPVRLEAHPEGNRVWIGGVERTADLHASEVDAGVSTVAGHPEIRRWVDSQLQALPAPFVAEGRDMGTNVFPAAPVKFYLTASPRVRALRRAQERPEEASAIEAALIERDRQDSRQIVPAADATVLDTSDLSAQEVIDRILKAVAARG
ncbi:(d)CMP kinase [Deinococcus lacus]|uniref:Cytidylate kinase n=1 Tax=Deinococcus lacus TaxID=392561 RepID=A0ABW1YEX7_9DEIO